MKNVVQDQVRGPDKIERQHDLYQIFLVQFYGIFK